MTRFDTLPRPDSRRATTLVVLVLAAACAGKDPADSNLSTGTISGTTGPGTTSGPTTGNTTSLSGEPVDLGTAGDFAILAKTGISSVPASVITGDLGVSPAAATYLTGFSLTLSADETSATSPQVTGLVYASDYAPPTPAKLTAAVADMELAFTDAAGRAAGTTELGAGDIGGMTLERASTSGGPAC